MSALPNLNSGEIAMIVVSVIVMIFLSYQILKWIHENKEEFKIKDDFIPEVDIPQNDKTVKGEPKYPLTLFDPGISKRNPIIREKI